MNIIKTTFIILCYCFLNHASYGQCEYENTEINGTPIKITTPTELYIDDNLGIGGFIIGGQEETHLAIIVLKNKTPESTSNITIELSNGKLFTLKQLTSKITLMNGVNWRMLTYYIDPSFINSFKSFNIKSISLELDKVNSTWRLSKNVDFLARHLKCIE